MSEQNALLRSLIRFFLLCLTLVPVVALFFLIRFFWHEFSCRHQPWVVQSIPAVRSFNWQHTGLVTLWFDDAYQFKRDAHMITKMDELGFTAAIAVPTGKICEREHMGWDDLVERQNKGWEMTSKLVNPLCDITLYQDDKKMLRQVTLSKKQLQAHGLRADHFVFPCGFSQSLVPNLYQKAKQHYASIRQSSNGINPLPVTDPYHLKAMTVNSLTQGSDIKRWLDAAQREKGWLILVFYRIDEVNTPYSTSTQRFLNILEMIKQSQLPVVIPSQVLNIKMENTSKRYNKSYRD